MPPVLAVVGAIVGAVTEVAADIGIAGTIVGSALGGAVGGALGSVIGGYIGSTIALDVTGFFLLSTASSLLEGKPPIGGTQVEFIADPQTGVPYLIGRTGTGGNIVMVDSAGTNSAFLTYITVLSLGPIQSFENFQANTINIQFTADNDEGANTQNATTTASQTVSAGATTIQVGTTAGFGTTAGTGISNVITITGGGHSETRTLSRVDQSPKELSWSSPLEYNYPQYSEITGSTVASGFKNRMWLKQALGIANAPYLTFTSTDSKDTPANHSGIPTVWTSNCQLSGLAATMWTLEYDAQVYSGGTPRPLNVVRGVYCYDPRRDSTYPGGSGSCTSTDEATWVYSENPFIHALTWLIGRHSNGVPTMGVHAPIAAIDVAAFVNGANVCDANGWTCGGVIMSTDSKWDVLTAMLQAGGGTPLKLGAKISCMVNTPLVSLATLTSADVVGKASIAGTTPSRERINAVWPRYREEQQGWQIVPTQSAIVVSDYVTFDGGQRTKEIQYALVQNATQVSQLARYDIENAREIQPISLPCKPIWMGYQPGDCITIAEAEFGFESQTMLLVSREVDPATLTTTLGFRTETYGKHAFALGTTGTPPVTPTMNGFDPSVFAGPLPGAFTATAGTLVSGGVTIPCINVAGVCDNALAASIVVAYSAYTYTDGAWVADNNWVQWASVPASTTLVQITGIAPNAPYDVEVSYISVKGVVSDPTIITSAGGVTTSNGYGAYVGTGTGTDTSNLFGGDGYGELTLSQVVTSLGTSANTANVGDQTAADVLAAIAAAAAAASTAETAAASALSTAETAEADAAAAASGGSGSDSSLTSAISAAQSDATSALAEVATADANLEAEIANRTTGDGDLQDQITSLTSSTNGDIASINTTLATLSSGSGGDDDSTIAAEITTLTTDVGNNTSTISSNYTTLSNDIDTLNSQVTTLSSTSGDDTDDASSVAADLSTEEGTRAAADSALSSDFTTLSATVSSLSSTVSSNYTTLTTANSTTASYVTTLQSQIGQPNNLQVDGGFENGLTGCSAVSGSLSSWTVANGTAFGTVVENSTNGTTSLKLPAFGTNESATYSISFDWQAFWNSGTTGGSIYVEAVDASSNTVLGTSPTWSHTSGNVNFGGTRQTFQFETSSTTTSVYLLLIGSSISNINIFGFRYFNAALGAFPVLPYNNVATAQQISANITSIAGTQATTNSSVAAEITSLSSSVGTNSSSISSNYTTFSNDISTINTQISSLTSGDSAGDVAANLSTEETTRADADSALSASITSLSSTVSSLSSTVSSNYTTLTSAQSTTAGYVTTLQSQIGAPPNLQINGGFENGLTGCFGNVGPLSDWGLSAAGGEWGTYVYNNSNGTCALALPTISSVGASSTYTVSFDWLVIWSSSGTPAGDIRVDVLDAASGSELGSSATHSHSAGSINFSTNTRQTFQFTTGSSTSGFYLRLIGEGIGDIIVYAFRYIMVAQGAFPVLPYNNDASTQNISSTVTSNYVSQASTNSSVASELSTLTSNYGSLSATVSSNYSTLSTANTATADYVTTLQAQIYANTNICPNGNGEGSAYGQAIPTGWTRGVNGSDLGGEVFYQDANFGPLIYGGGVTSTGSGCYVLYNGPFFPAAASQTYSVSANMQGLCTSAGDSPTAESVSCYIQMVCCSGANGTGTYTYGGSDEIFTSLNVGAEGPNAKFTYVTPAGTVSAFIRIFVGAPVSGQNYALWFQRVKCELGPHVTAYTAEGAVAQLSATVVSHATALEALGTATGTYSIQVGAGNVVTGLTLISQSGAGGTISAITFSADVVTFNGDVVVEGTLTNSSLAAGQITGSFYTADTTTRNIATTSTGPGTSVSAGGGGSSGVTSRTSTP